MLKTCQKYDKGIQESKPPRVYETDRTSGEKERSGTTMKKKAMMRLNPMNARIYFLSGDFTAFHPFITLLRF